MSVATRQRTCLSCGVRHTVNEAHRGPERARQVIGQANAVRRLSLLGARCRELELGLYNSESDPGPLFEGLPYVDVMAIALSDPVVARVLTRLPASWRWPDE